jgi:hypothetical protein
VNGRGPCQSKLGSGVSCAHLNQCEMRRKGGFPAREPHPGKFTWPIAFVAGSRQPNSWFQPTRNGAVPGPSAVSRRVMLPPRLAAIRAHHNQIHAWFEFEPEEMRTATSPRGPTERWLDPP